ncbi:helix-turn-helix domain-containing protein [Streptomyces canus]|uniref:helix-turn-helix domain-containing protein n=1 Tax=Streptomyces canus TaxID=58343 RepID=UPI0027824537|nr:helix-turn-helix domain-containing protein [Streptomyces canus]MDQ0763890.1 transcriptional regulator with XRE-family HTH domain [Streptomyces canus]
MNEKRAGRPRKPLPATLPPAFKRFALQLRRHADESAVTTRQLAARTHISLTAASRALNGERRIDARELDSFIDALGLNETQRASLVFLHQQAMDEAHGAQSHGREGAGTGPADILAELRQEAAISLREISHRLTVAGSPMAKSTVERILEDPNRSPLQALQVGTILIEALPEHVRGPAAEKLHRSYIGPAHNAAIYVMGQPGAGKSELLASLRSSMPVASEEAMASLARRLDLPVSELLAFRETAQADQIPGRPISEWSALELGVHRAAAPIGTGENEESELPPYIPRSHDELLADAVRDAAAGRSQMLVVTGNSTTGKTRACWEAIQSLSQQGWRLWHPFNPTPAEAAMDGIARVEPRTVVWLDDVERYLLAPELGERVAYAIGRLLRQLDRGPILVLGTIWPRNLDQLTASPAPNAPDLHEQARRLLSGRIIFVPDRFDPVALSSAKAQSAIRDPRLAEAVEQSGSDGRLTQYLASGPQLMNLFSMAMSASKAVLEAAMDACRLGISSPLPQSFLTEAAVGYLSDSAFAVLTEDWAEQVFAELTRPVTGGSSPLRRIRPRPTLRTPGSPPAHGAPVRSVGPTYRLADHLDLAGRRTRQFLCPPDSFWLAAYNHLTVPEDLEGLAEAADDRYRLQWAHHLRRRAAEVGDEGLLRLTRLREEAGDREQAEYFARAAAAAGYTSGLRELVRMREEAGDFESAEALARQAAESGDGLALAELAWTYEEQGDSANAEQLAQQAAAVGDTFALRELARMREVSGDITSAEALYRQAAVDFHDTPSLLRLAEMRQEAGDRNEARRFARAADSDDVLPLIDSARARQEEGDWEGAETLYRQAADAGNAFALEALARMREEAGDRSGAEALYRQTADAGLAWLVNPARRWPYGLNPDGAPTPPWGGAK